MKSSVKKGTALILTVAVTSLLIMLALGVMTAAFSNQISTFGMDRASQLRLIAQTGMEKSISILREKIVQQVLKDDDSGSSILYTFAKYPVSETMSQLDLDAQTELPDSGQKYSIYFNIYRNQAFSLNSAGQTARSKNLGDCYVTYTDGTDDEKHVDPSDGILKNCIKISLVAYGRGESRRTETVYIDKNSVSNYYLEKLFHNTLTALGEKGTADSEPIRTESNDSLYSNVGPVQIGGDVYLQGEKLLLDSDENIQVDGKIKINTADDAIETNFRNNLVFYGYNGDGAKVSSDRDFPHFPTDLQHAFIIKGQFTDPTMMTMTPTIENTNLRTLNTLDIKKIDGTDYEVLSNNKFDNVTDASNSNYVMIGAKCKPRSGSAQVDFNQLVLGKDLDSHTGMRRLIAQGLEFKKNAKGDSETYSNEADYIKLFKVILVKGDLLIDSSRFNYDQITDNTPDEITASDFRKMRMMNYMIIASGTVTIKGSVEMYGSTIMAKDIVFQSSSKDMPTTSAILEGEASEVYDESDEKVLSVIQDLNTLQGLRITSGETIHTDEDGFPNPLHDRIQIGMNFVGTTNSNNVLVRAGTALAEAYDAARTERIRTSIFLSGIGTDDSVREISKESEEYQDTPWSDARGFVTNVQKALLNEYLTRNLSDDYAKQLKFKIIDWQEQ
jgi:hypothetical protein